LQVLTCLILIGGTSFLLHTRISDEEVGTRVLPVLAPCSSIISLEGLTRCNACMQGSGLHVVSHPEGGHAASAADRVQLLAQDQQADQLAHAQSGKVDPLESGSAAKGGTLFGAKGGVKLANGEQAAAVAARRGAARSAGSGANTPPSAKVEAAHRVTGRFSSRSSVGTLASSFPPRPDPPIVELTEAEVARCVWWAAGGGRRCAAQRLALLCLLLPQSDKENAALCSALHASNRPSRRRR
jgi:hypothetical protein